MAQEFSVGDRVRVRLDAAYGSLNGVKGVIVAEPGDTLADGSKTLFYELLPFDVEEQDSAERDWTWPCAADELELLHEGE